MIQTRGWVSRMIGTVLLFCMVAVATSLVLPLQTPACADETQIKTTGGEIPIPFKNANLKVELASGELYILRGRVRVFAEVPFFEVNLDQHNWLASEIRTQSPYYVLEGVLPDWRNYEGQNIQIYARAVGKIFQRGEQRFYGIWLQSLAEPIRVDKGDSCGPSDSK